MPGLASAHEQGLTGFDVPSWYAIFLPKGAPPAIVNKLRDATVAAMEKPLIRQRLNDIGCDQIAPERSSPEYLRNFVASEIEKWAIPIKASGVQID
jgi:tripartite-type tricarboxylate transporter receptor subunit TctC